MDKRLQFYQKRIEPRSGLKWEVERSEVGGGAV